MLCNANAKGISFLCLRLAKPSGSGTSPARRRVARLAHASAEPALKKKAALCFAAVTFAASSTRCNPQGPRIPRGGGEYGWNASNLKKGLRALHAFRGIPAEKEGVRCPCFLE